MDTAGFQLEIVPTSDYLLATASGRRNLDSVRAVALEISRAALAASSHNVLVDVSRLEGTLGPLDSFLLVSATFEQLRRSGIKKAAIVDPRRPTLPQTVLETIARNRGFDLRVFPGRDQAAAWLRE